jgi:preprotein translocase subunit SecG
LEKGTWVLAIVVTLLCLFSTVFVPKSVSNNTRVPEKVNATSVPQQQQPAAPAGNLPATPKP